MKKIFKFSKKIHLSDWSKGIGWTLNNHGTTSRLQTLSIRVIYMSIYLNVGHRPELLQRKRHLESKVNIFTSMDVM